MAGEGIDGRIVLRSARVVLDGGNEGADVEVAAGAIVAVHPWGSQDGAIDLGDSLLAPGLIDVQVNGGFGADFSVDPSSIWKVAERLPETGVTAFVPTVVTGPETVAEQALDVLRHRPAGFVGAEPLGLHIEGPALSPVRKGAHNPDLLTDMPHMRAAADPGTLIVTLAPEVAGIEVIRNIAESGPVVSVGHTDASYDQSVAAFNAGARHVTHLFNAMRPISHREPGPIAAALLDDRVTVSVIPDGVHVHPDVLRLVAATVGFDRVVAITDGSAAMGMPPGDYSIGSLHGVSDGVTIRLPDGTLAGSVLTMDRAVRILAESAGLGVAFGIAAASTNPARTISDSARGRIVPGARADFCVLDGTMSIQATLVAGRVVFGALR